LGVAPRYPEELSLLRTISDLFIPGIRVFSLGLELCNLQIKETNMRNKKCLNWIREKPLIL